MPRDDVLDMSWSEFRPSWPVLAGATLAYMGGAVCLPYYTAGLFISPLQAEFGWSRSGLSLGPALLITGFVLTSPIFGALSERVEPRRLVPFGMLAVAAAFALLSLLNGTIVQYYATLIFMAFAGNLSGPCVITPILAGAFDQARGTAIGIAMAGIGLGAAIGSPLIASVIANEGWRQAYRCMALFSLLAIPIVWAMFWHTTPYRSSSPAHHEQGLAFRAAIQHPLFWLLWFCFFSVAVASTGLIIHFVPLLVDQGVEPSAAAAMSSLIGISVIFGRLATGLLIDRFFAPRIGAAILGLSSAGFAIFLFGGAKHAMVAALAIGISFGAETDLIGFLAARYFGLRHYGRIFGLLYGLCLFGSAVSPVLYGLVADLAGSYRPMIGAAAGLLIIAMIILLMLPGFPNWAEKPGERNAIDPA